jgi:hypothetical protein
MAISRRFPNRSYRLNDSGDTGRFFVIDGNGDTRAVSIAAFRPRDNEDMALGPCGENHCLFIADIGDNARARKELEIVVVEEMRDYPAEVPAKWRLRIRYPDGPHDAESLGIHPNGDLYILTKDPLRQQIFRLKRNQWFAAEDILHTLEIVTTIDMSRMIPVSTIIDRPATGMDISPDGKRVVILTYRSALELFVDFGSAFPDPAEWKEGVHYRAISLEILEQQEAVAWLPDGSGFVYDTERPIASRPARIMQVFCQ